MELPEILTASVKVMRSFDYCHFEVALTASLSGDISNADVVTDELRKKAARLADKAVEQYKVAKTAAGHIENLRSKWQLKQAEEAPENERSPFQKAIIKYHQDASFASRFDYDYQDDYDPQDVDDE